MEKQGLEQILYLYLPYRPMVQWLRPDDNSLIQSELTISDYNFLLHRHGGKLMLYPLLKIDNVFLINNVEDKALRGRIFELVFNLVENQKSFTELQLTEIQLLAAYHIDFASLIEKGYAVEKGVVSHN